MRSCNKLKLIINIALMIVCSLSNCHTYCEDCTVTKKSQVMVQTCNICKSGYVLDGSTCVLDVVTVSAILISACVVIITQIIVMVICRIKYSSIMRKSSQISLEDIYRQEDEEASDSESKKSDTMKTQFKIYVKNQCGVCLKDKTSIKTACGHYFHHNCFKNSIIDNPEQCPKCKKRGISPIQMICSCCISKKRQIPLQSITSFQYFRQYICVTCKIRLRNEEDQKKWWKRCC